MIRLRKFLSLFFLVLLLNSLVFPVIAEGSSVGTTIESTEPTEPEQVVVLIYPAVAISVEGAEAFVAVLLASTVSIDFMAKNDVFAWILKKLDNFLKVESDTEKHPNDNKDLRLEEIEISNRTADKFSFKDDRILSSIASTFFSFVTEVENLINSTEYTNTYEEDVKKLLKKQKTEYEEASKTKKDEMKIYYPCLPVGRVTSKALYENGLNLQEATTYVKDYWEPTNKKDLDIITVSAEAAQALAKNVSAEIGKGGYSFTCRDSEIRHNKEGDLMHCHPGMKNPNPSGDPEIVQADNLKTDYCPHLLYVIEWN